MPNNDPRNIFVDHRQNYSDEPATTPTPDPTTSGTRSGATPPPHESTHGKGAQQGSTATNPQDDYAQKVEEMKRLAAKYQRAGEGQLVKDIVNNVIEQKARGTLSNQQLIAFANRISPLLNAEQRGRLNDLLNELLKI